MHKITSYWQSKNWLSFLLYPLSLVFCSIVFVRRACYRLGLLKVNHAEVPIVIVGNISVGGTGKTPLLIFLLQQLLNKGIRVAVISRGYGAKHTLYLQGQSVLVSADMTADQVGDEPKLIASKTGVPVVIGRSRYDSVKLILQQHNSQVILSDDGLQHYALNRDIEIAVIDQQKMFGNEWCLPAGPLREPIERLAEVDYIFYHQSEPKTYTEQPSAINSIVMSLIFTDVFQLNQRHNRQDITFFKKQTVHAVAGIGHPTRFFQQLRHAGIDIIEHSFVDHHVYQPQDVEFDDDFLVLMTEKDAIKCEKFKNDKLWCVPVEVAVGDSFSIDDLINKLQLNS